MEEHKLYNGTVTILFDPVKHIYYDDKGNRLISVTGATGMLDKSSALMGWAIKLMGKYLEKVGISLEKVIEGLITEPKVEFTVSDNLDMSDAMVITSRMIESAKRDYRLERKKSADIGTQIHDWISLKIAGKNPKLPIKRKVLNGVTAFLKFQKAHKTKWLANERLVYSRRYNYVGKVDEIAFENMLGFNQLSVDDFKSSNGIYDEMKYQVAGYTQALKEELNYLKRTRKPIKSAKDRRLLEAYKACKGFNLMRIIRFGKESGDFEVKQLYHIDHYTKGFLACLTLKKIDLANKGMEKQRKQIKKIGEMARKLKESTKK